MSERTRARLPDGWPIAAATAAWTGAVAPTLRPLVLAAVMVLVMVMVMVLVAVVAVLVPGVSTRTSGVAVEFGAPLAACVLLLLATNTLAGRSLDGLDPPPDGPFDGVIELVTDPEQTPAGAHRFEVRTEHGRLLADARSPTAMALLDRLLAGDRARVRGATGSFSRPTSWTRSRHLAGTLRVESVLAIGGGGIHHDAANSFRRVLDRGAGSLPDRHRSLLAGLVLGDDRAQPPELTADFRAAGLTHLLAVSGQNVLFVLVVAGPLLRRLRLWPRFVSAVAVVSAFALLTRFEPSVVRAAFVAGVALFAKTTGRGSGGVRHLALAVCLLLLIDPLLVHSLGFRLSVAASIGVLTLAPPIVARLPGPRWFREGLGVTTGAQLAVAPVLVPVLGPMPLSALPANVAAGPIAGVLMVWGLTAGTVAGVAGGPVAWVLHLPTGVALTALERVAMMGAALPAGSVDLRHIGAVAGAALLARSDRTWARPVVVVVLAVAVLAPVLTAPVQGARPAGRGATVWVDGRLAVVDVTAGARAVDVLEELRAARVAAIGLVVVRSARPEMEQLVHALRSRFGVGAVIGPPGLPLDDMVVPPAGFRSRVGRLRVVVDRSGPPLRARVGWAHESERAVGTAPALGSTGAPTTRLRCARSASVRRRPYRDPRVGRDRCRRRSPRRRRRRRRLHPRRPAV